MSPFLKCLCCIYIGYILLISTEEEEQCVSNHRVNRMKSALKLRDQQIEYLRDALARMQEKNVNPVDVKYVILFIYIVCVMERI